MGSLRGIIKSTIKSIESKNVDPATGYGATESSTLPLEITSVLKDLLGDAFAAYDSDKNGTLERSEIRVFLKDFHENIDEDDVTAILRKVDNNNDNLISLDEFVVLCYHLIVYKEGVSIKGNEINTTFQESVKNIVFSNDGDDLNDEVEEMPEDFCDLSPEEQQIAIKLRAFKMLAIGTLMVLYFSDPMVEVMQEIAVRANISPFYVSFVLAPLASNSSEVLASVFYAKKKTRKTMTVALSTLEGAECMNNTFCLSIFMGLIYMRGLAWQYTSETISIVLVQYIIFFMARGDTMSVRDGLIIMAIFPLSIALVAGLEAVGFD